MKYRDENSDALRNEPRCRHQAGALRTFTVSDVPPDVQRSLGRFNESVL